MIKSVLAYNFNPDRLQQLRQACMILKVNCKAVAPEQFDDAVGFLAGVKDCSRAAVNPPQNQEDQLFEALEEAAQKAGKDPETVKKEAAESLAQAAQKEMVFLCGFDMHLLKAMLTPSNRQWSGRHLLQELAAEHVYMKQYGKSVHK